MYHIFHSYQIIMNYHVISSQFFIDHCTSFSIYLSFFFFFFFFSSRRRHTRCSRDWSSDVCSSDLYVHRVITQIFRVSVDPHVMSNVQGQRLIFLPGVNEELNAAGAPLKLTIDVLEQAIMEAANTWPHDKPLMSYLLPCWKRAVSASNSAKTATG